MDAALIIPHHQRPLPGLVSQLTRTLTLSSYLHFVQFQKSLLFMLVKVLFYFWVLFVGRGIRFDLPSSFNELF